MALNFDKSKKGADQAVASDRCAADNCPFAGSAHRAGAKYCTWHNVDGLRSGEAAWQASMWLRTNQQLLSEAHRCATNFGRIPPERLEARHKGGPISHAEALILMAPSLDWRAYPELKPKEGESVVQWGDRANLYIERELSLIRRTVQASANRPPPPVTPRPQARQPSDGLSQGMKILAEKMADQMRVAD